MERFEIKVCIGLFGVCVISILGDSDGVNDDIANVGVEDWYESLPKHDAPVEGIYTIIADVTYYDICINYDIVKVVKQECKYNTIVFDQIVSLQLVDPIDLSCGVSF